MLSGLSQTKTTHPHCRRIRCSRTCKGREALPGAFSSTQAWHCGAGKAMSQSGAPAMPLHVHFLVMPPKSFTRRLRY